MSENVITTALADLESEFSFLPDWEERFRYVVELGRELAPLTDAEHNDANKVRGCSSQVWLVSDPSPDGSDKLIFRGDSDAVLVRGLVAILLRLYNGAAPDEILAFDIKGALNQLGLADALSPQRSNGLYSMIARIRREAEAALQARGNS